MALLSKEWMATRTAFRALVQEAIKKQVAFSDTTYLFIKQFVVTAVHRKMQLQGSKPWADETRRAQQSDLQEFTNQPVQVVTDAEMTKEFGRKGRAIRLDD
jgi:alpha-amylase/alpha-mannosidase (GH57 family)